MKYLALSVFSFVFAFATQAQTNSPVVRIDLVAECGPLINAEETAFGGLYYAFLFGDDRAATQEFISQYEENDWDVHEPALFRYYTYEALGGELYTEQVQLVVFSPQHEIELMTTYRPISSVQLLGSRAVSVGLHILAPEFNLAAINMVSPGADQHQESEYHAQARELVSEVETLDELLIGMRNAPGGDFYLGECIFFDDFDWVTQ